MDRIVLIVLCAALLAAPSRSTGQTCGIVQDLGALPEGGPPAQARGVSADGSIVVGWSYTANRDRAFRWTAAEGMQNLGVLPGHWGSQAYGVSADGAVVVGICFSNGTSPAFRWTAAGGMESLGTLIGAGYAYAQGVSADGSVVVGYSSYTENQRAFRWTAAGGMQNLGTLPGGNSSSAFAVSADGSVVVGSSGSSGTSQAVRWNTAGGIQSLGTLPGETHAYAYGVSADGSVVVGVSYSTPSLVYRAFRWTAEAGMQDLGTLPGGTDASACGVTAHGSVVVGYGHSSTGMYHAFRWTAAAGMEDLGTAAGGSISRAYGVSADGSVVVGAGDNEDGGEHAIVWGGDTDGDGIPDDWECNGIPYIKKSDSTVGRYMLPGANWLKKDVYVEVDAMAEHAPSADVLQRVIDAFDPPGRELVPAVPNVSGALPNITLHIETDPADLALNLFDGGNYTQGVNGFTDFGYDKDRFFGTPDDRADPDWGTPDDPGSKKLAKLKVYRYCMFANTFGGTRSSGVAKGIPSNDFMVTLGSVAYPKRTPDVQAGTFMHELGHTLGLRHGGGAANRRSAIVEGVTVDLADVNWRPNYYSVMNYWWQIPKRWQGNAWGLRYSEAALPTIDEIALSESAGLGASLPGVRVPYRVTSTSTCPGVLWYMSMPFNLASLEPGATVDWDGDCVPEEYGLVMADVNNFSGALPSEPAPDTKARVLHGMGYTLLEGHQDWANLIYNFRGSPTYALGSPAEPDISDFTPEISEFLDSIPPQCPPDFNNSGVVSVQDIFDFLAAYFSGDPFADFNNSGVISVQDIFDFLAAYFAGCP